MPRLVFLFGPGECSEIPLDKERLVIGRSSKADGSFPNDEALSRNHFVLLNTPDGWAIEDSGSKNGTLVNGHRIDDRVLLRHDDRIEAGQLLFRFLETDALDESDEPIDPWDHVLDAFSKALRLDPHQREQFLSMLQSHQPEIGNEIEELLQYHQGEEGVLDHSGVFAGVLPRPHAHIGTTVGSFKILEQLASGGMADIFLAEAQGSSPRRVALKLLDTTFAPDEIDARFQAEHHALEKLRHPNIAEVLEAGLTPGGIRYYAMDFVAGPFLTDYCRNEKPDLASLSALFQQLCSALDHAHACKIVHRDIKPANVLVRMLETGPHLTVIDFGVAKSLGDKLADRTIRTRVGAILGTPGYMSPEQALGEAVDPRTDLWAVGCLLFECLTGSAAFSGTTPSSFLSAVLTKEPSWDQLDRRAPADLQLLVKRLLAKNPESRPSSAQEVSELLSQVS